jgi:activating signal cointegrator complex subunit 2
MSVPPFAPFPGKSVRENILPQEWSLYLDSWISLTELYLRLDDREFFSNLNEPSSLTDFLVSLFHELAEDPTLAPNVIALRRKSFFLLHRIFSGSNIPEQFLNWSILSKISVVFPKSEQLRSLLQTVWKQKGDQIEKSLQTAKSSLIKSLDSKNPENARDLLDRLGPLLKSASNAAIFMLIGSDLLDSLALAYSKTSPEFQKKLVTTAYFGLVALLEGPKPNYSLLSDHLYSLKTSAEQDKKADSTKKNLLSDLVTNTPLLHKIRDSPITPEAARVKNTAAQLNAFQQSSSARSTKIIRRKIDKGKGKAKDDTLDHGTSGEVHVHRMSLITQIQDLFPDLGAGFVVKLLDEYKENIEDVIAHLLEDSLPPHLANANWSEQL